MMSSESIIKIIIMSLLAAENITAFFLLTINLNSALKFKRNYPGSEETEKRVDYTLARGQISFVSRFISTAFFILFFLSGSFGTIEALVGEALNGVYLKGIIYLGVISLIFSLLDLPLSLYSQFVLEEKFGFNKTTPALFLKDTLKGIILSAILGIPLLAGFFFFMEKTGHFWWLYAFGFFFLFQIVLTALYPVLIAPLFNKFTPLEEGELKTRLERLAQQTGFKTAGIFTMDGSRRSGHSNAYFTGLGPQKRIVLFDTLIESLTLDEIEAVLAHEIGHYQKKHIVKGMISSFLGSLLLFFILSLIYPLQSLYSAFGFSGISYHAMLTLLMYGAGSLFFFLTPLGSYFSRKHEFEADAYAAEQTGTGQFLIDALSKLNTENLSHPDPHPAYTAFYAGHPSFEERKRALEVSETKSEVLLTESGKSS